LDGLLGAIADRPDQAGSCESLHRGTA
jgi:hypothetical protein